LSGDFKRKNKNKNSAFGSGGDSFYLLGMQLPSLFIYIFFEAIFEATLFF